MAEVIKVRGRKEGDRAYIFCRSASGNWKAISPKKRNLATDEFFEAWGYCELDALKKAQEHRKKRVLKERMRSRKKEPAIPVVGRKEWDNSLWLVVVRADGSFAEKGEGDRYRAYGMTFEQAAGRVREHLARQIPARRQTPGQATIPA